MTMQPPGTHQAVLPWLLNVGLLILMAGLTDPAHSISGQAGHADSASLNGPAKLPPEYKALVMQAEAGSREAQTELGLLRIEGDKVPRDLKIARIWLGRAAVKNHVPAQYYLGQLLLLDVYGASEQDLNRQLREGLGWLHRAAREHYPPAQLLYSKTVLESQFDTLFGHSKLEAQQHLMGCANNTLACAEYALQRLDQEYPADDCGLNEVCEKKRALLYMHANSGDSTAMYRLSRFDNEDHLFWLRRAARLGHAEASFVLAEMALSQSTVLLAEDPSVLALLENAAQQGKLDAMHRLGTLLFEGTRFPVNKALGEEWLKQAANLGHPPSVELLNEFQATKNPTADPVEVKSAISHGTPQ